MFVVNRLGNSFCLSSSWSSEVGEVVVVVILITWCNSDVNSTLSSFFFESDISSTSLE